MKKTTILAELRSLDAAALARRITELEQRRDRARLDASFGSVKNHQALPLIRQQLAQAKTIQHAHLLTETTRSTPSISLGTSRAARSGSALHAEETK